MNLAVLLLLPVSFVDESFSSQIGRVRSFCGLPFFVAKEIRKENRSFVCEREEEENEVFSLSFDVSRASDFFQKIPKK